MQHERLVQDFEKSASIALLRSPIAPLILSFFYSVFKQRGLLTITHQELLEQLDHYLEELRDWEPQAYPNSAANYLRQWCDGEHRFLRRYHESGSDEPVYELTTDSERVLGWVHELRKREFVGTESRFLRIFGLLHEIVEMSTADPEIRLAQLQARQDELQAQIDAIYTSGQVEMSTTTQLKERLTDATTTAYQLVADFREVAENFRTIASDIKKQQLQSGITKGKIVADVLDADTALKDSDQGRSFYTFWQFLISHSKQDELQTLLDQVYILPELPMDHGEFAIFRQLKRRLLDAGSRIVESNRRLAEQLRKLLDEEHLSNARRTQELIAQFKQLAVRVDPAEFDRLLGNKPFLGIDGTPAINMPMERQLWRPVKKREFADTRVEIGAYVLSEDELAHIIAFDQVDMQHLVANIEAVHKHGQPVTLDAVLERFPIQHGLAELVTYIIIATKHDQHTIQPTPIRIITLPDGAHERIIHIPHVVYFAA